VKTVYFDHAATTPVDPGVLEVMLPYFSERFGNASEVHTPGRLAKAGLDHARAQVAAALGAHEREIVFTGGGTESDNLALVGTLQAQQPAHLVVGAVEHPAIVESARFLQGLGWDVTFVPVDRHGKMTADAVSQALRDDTRLVSIMLANNVVGTLQPIREIAALAHERGVTVHTDAVQAVGAVPVDVDDLGVDMLSLSGHKLYGPKGIGALYVRRGTRIKPALHGGGQERGLRSGTENVAGAVGLGAAIEMATAALPIAGPHMIALRERLLAGILAAVPEVESLGHREERLPGNVCVSVRYIEGESMILKLDADGIAASSGSACASQSLEPSHVILAMGYDAVAAHGSLRLSLGRENTDADVDHFLAVFPGIVEQLRAMSPLYAAR
jgi:cysteine desulfurase